MPILRPPNDPDPLSQGDLLKGLRLYATAGNWDDSDELGGSAERIPDTELGLVISRPCVALHKPQIVVAAIHGQRESPPEGVDSYEKIKAFLGQLRDGHHRPDRFYLGHIPGLPPGRYYAHLDSLHTIAKPTDEKLESLLRSHRIASLDQQFRQDLHLRLFAAHASLGFDDLGWYPDHDLQWVIQAGEVDLNKLRAGASTKRADIAKLAASGTVRNEKHLDNLTQEAENIELNVAKLEAEIAAFRSEAARRPVS